MPEKIPQNQVIKSMVFAVVSTTETVDKATSWATGGIAAALSLILANIRDFTHTFQSTNAKWIFALLLLALLMGVISKILHVSIKQAIEVQHNFDNFIAKQGDKVDPNDIMASITFMYRYTVPWYLKKSFRESISPEAIANNTFLTKAGNNYNRQKEFSLLMILFAVAAIIYAIITI